MKVRIMEKVPQKLDKTRKEYYSNAVVAKFGERIPDFTGMGRVIKEKATKIREVVCVEACRTPYGTFGGSLKQFSAAELGGLAIKEVLRRTSDKVKPEDVDYVIMGHVVPAGCGQVPSRQATLLGGLPESVPSITVNKVCSSGIKTIDLAYQMIQLGRAEIVIAGGQDEYLDLQACELCQHLLARDNRNGGVEERSGADDDTEGNGFTEWRGH